MDVAAAQHLLPGELLVVLLQADVSVLSEDPGSVPVGERMGSAGRNAPSGLAGRRSRLPAQPDEVLSNVVERLADSGAGLDLRLLKFRLNVLTGVLGEDAVGIRCDFPGLRVDQVELLFNSDGKNGRPPVITGSAPLGASPKLAQRKECYSGVGLARCFPENRNWLESPLECFGGNEG